VSLIQSTEFTRSEKGVNNSVSQAVPKWKQYFCCKIFAGHLSQELWVYKCDHDLLCRIFHSFQSFLKYVYIPYVKGLRPERMKYIQILFMTDSLSAFATYSRITN
jgi:hypothetical protein